MTTASRRDILRFRLASQRIASPPDAGIAEVVRHFLAMQAQDFGQALWALGGRVPGCTRDDVLAALERGEVVRSWPMRGTLHWTPPEDLLWMLRLTVPRQHSSVAARYRQLELDGPTLGRAQDAAVAALAGGGRLDRVALLQKLMDAGVATDGQRGPTILGHLSQLGVIVQGPPAGTGQAFVLLDEWAPHPRVLERDEALREFVLRYFTAHGPATVADFTWWSKVTVADAKRGLELCRDELREFDHDGKAYWMAASVADSAPTTLSSRVRLLAGFDEYLLGYRDRSHSLAAEFADRIVPGGNGIFLPTIVSAGRIVGTWKREHGTMHVTVTPVPFEAFTDAEESGVAREAARYASFAGLSLRLR